MIPLHQQDAAKELAASMQVISEGQRLSAELTWLGKISCNPQYLTGLQIKQNNGLLMIFVLHHHLVTQISWQLPTQQGLILDCMGC